MSHNGLHERVLIEVARSDGSNFGNRGYSYPKLQQDVRIFRGMNYDQVYEAGLEFDGRTRISRSEAAYFFREKGSLRDRLNPLEGFIRSRVGKAWNNVEAEIRDKVKGRSDSVRHVLQHVYDLVEPHPVWSDGVPCYNPGVNYFTRPIQAGDFYIDQDGILREVAPCCNLQQWYRQPKPEFESQVLAGKKFSYRDRNDWRLRPHEVKEFGWYLVGPTYTFKHRLVLQTDGSPVWDTFGLPVTEIKKEVEEVEVPLRKATDSEVVMLNKLRSKNKSEKKVRAERLPQNRLYRF